MKLVVLEAFGSLIYDMRHAHNRWPRKDGGRWMVRTGEVDTYRRTFIGAVWLAWRSA